jgi:hypothetical protein
MDNPIQRIVPVDDPVASWRGYWAGVDGLPIPAGSNGAFVRGYRCGRVDAGLDAPTEEQLVDIAFWALHRYVYLPWEVR